MKKIRIFIGSSIEELALERAELMRFIGGLNNKYVDRGLYIEGYVCEETPASMRAGGSQKAHNDYIKADADATIFMFYHKAGEYTMEELRLAREAFLAGGRPDVFVFFKAVDKAPDITEDVQKAVDLVANEYGHYYKLFNDVDTVKLELLQFLADAMGGEGALAVKDGKVYLNGEAVEGIAAANVFAYQNNPNLKALKEQIAELESLMHEADDSVTELRLSKSIGELKKQYAELESDILGALLFFHEQNRKGRKADKTLEKALRYLELGRIDIFKALIPQEELDALARSIKSRRELMEAQLREDEETLLTRTKARIQALRLDIENPQRFHEIEHAYESAYEAAKEAKDYAFIYDYAGFLYDQKNYPKGIEIAETLYARHIDPANRNDISDHDRARLLNLLANLYKNTGRPQEAEQLYLEALEIYRRLAETVSREAYEPDIAMTCNNLANLYKNTGRPQEAEQFYLKALEIRRRLAETVSREAYEPAVATTCNNLAALYADTGRPQEAEQLYLEALEIRRRLAETIGPEAYEPDIAETCNNLAALYADTGKPQEAEKLYLEALEVYRRLAETVSREAYEPYVATTCNNLAILYADTGRPQEAEKLYLEALEIYRRLAETVSRKAYEPDVAMTCNNLAALYTKSGRPKEAEELFFEALTIRRRLAETVSREAYEPYVAMTCFNMGILYKKMNKSDLAKQYFDEALSIAKRYQDVDPRCKRIVDALS